MHKMVKRFAYLHCIVHSIVQGNTTLAKSQSLEIKTVSWCTEISGPCPLMGNWQTLEYSMVLTKYFQQFLKGLKNTQPHSFRS